MAAVTAVFLWDALHLATVPVVDRQDLVQVEVQTLELPGIALILPRRVKTDGRGLAWNKNNDILLIVIKYYIESLFFW